MGSVNTTGSGDSGGWRFWRRWFGTKQVTSDAGLEDRLIVGLGNPGADYSDSRHNAGFLLIDHLLDRFKARPVAGSARFVLWRFETENHAVYLMKPTTYMNLSGHALSEFLGRVQVRPDQILVAYDDVALPLGTIRLRPSGSAGGQKGMRHIIESLGSTTIPRLRIGIRAANVLDRSLADFVLAAFDDEELPLLKEVLARAADACATWLAQDMTAAMAAFNSRTSSSNKKPDPDASRERSRDGTHELGGES